MDNFPAKGDRRRRIAILSGFSLSRNPRVRKEAQSLQASGYDVTVLGASTNQSSLAEDTELAERAGFLYRPVGLLCNHQIRDRILSVTSRGRRWLGQQAADRLGIQNRFQLGYFVTELSRAALAIRADLYIAHLEQGIWVGSQLRKLDRPVGIDMEDWYSEDLPAEARKHRPIRLLRTLERTLLRAGTHSTCPSRVMSSALQKEYDCPAPAVIYNAFEWAERASIDGLSRDRHTRKVLSLHWVSQTLGAGRGLEDLFSALPHLNQKCEIHLRGASTAEFVPWLECQVPTDWMSQIYLHPPVPTKELLSRICEHDIGFAGEMKYCANKNLTVANKILHYLLGGLAVVASDTLGHIEVADSARGAVSVYKSGDSRQLAAILNGLLGSPEKLSEAKAASLKAAFQTFCWERQINKLVSSVEHAIR